MWKVDPQAPLNLKPIKIIDCVAQRLNTSKDDLSVVLVTVYDHLR